MFSNQVMILEDGVYSGSEYLTSDHGKFYLNSYETLRTELVEGEVITCYALGKRFATSFRQSPPYIYTLALDSSAPSTPQNTNTKELDNCNTQSGEDQTNEIEKSSGSVAPMSFKASNYGMVIYQNLDPYQSVIQVDTQSLYYCTKIVIIDKSTMVDIHLPINEKTLDLILDKDIDEMIDLLVNNYQLSIFESKWFTISGNDRNNTSQQDNEPNVSNQFVTRLLSRMEVQYRFPKEHLTKLDMQIKIDYQVDFINQTIVPIEVHLPKLQRVTSSLSSSSSDNLSGLDDAEKSPSHGLAPEENCPTQTTAQSDNTNQTSTANVQNINWQFPEPTDSRRIYHIRQSFLNSFRQSSQPQVNDKAFLPQSDRVGCEPKLDNEGLPPRSPRSEPSTPRLTKRRQL